MNKLICILLVTLLLLQVEAKHLNAQKKLKNDKTFLGKLPRQGVEDYFGVIFDADLEELPLIHPQTALSDKASPGISSFNNNLPGLRGYLDNLLQKVKNVVPQQKWASTPIMLAATAGMRLLSQADQYAILQQSDQFLKSSGFFYKGEKWNRVITGQEEGILLWIATNFLKGTLKDIKLFNRDQIKTYATIDLGGASTQIAFKVVQPEYDNSHDFDVTLPQNNDHTIYSNTYLGYGNDQARNSVVKASQDKTNNSINSGCYNEGFSEPLDGVTVNGTSKPDECLEGIRKFLNAKNCPYPTDQECSINQNYQALIPKDMDIIAVSGVTAAINAFKISEPFRPQQLLDAARVVCSQDLQTVQRNDPNNQYYKTKCFLGLYTASLLIDGFKVGDRQIYSPEKINGVGPAWSLGFMLDEISDLNCDVSNQGACQLKKVFEDLKTNIPI